MINVNKRNCKILANLVPVALHHPGVVVKPGLRVEEPPGGAALVGEGGAGGASRHLRLGLPGRRGGGAGAGWLLPPRRG